jgi:malate dehydrogenase (oxaloacetate-decarboxylating)
MDYLEESLKKHYQWRGKLEMSPKMPIAGKIDLSLAYTPGVAAPCLEIQRDRDKVWDLTGRWNTVAVVTDGSAVLGLGDIGPEAGMPVMEGKCVLFKTFGGVDAVPLCIRSKNIDDIVNTVSLISGSFGGINLEDISAPRCFEIERRLKERCDIPVFHDDQHGTAIVVLAALLNALKLTGRRLESCNAVISGAGAAGIAVTKLLVSIGLKNAVVCDREGAVYKNRPGLSGEKLNISEITNFERKKGGIAEVIRGADVFIGVSSPGILSPAMVRSMAAKPILFAMANPMPEIMPDAAFASGAAVVGTGRSDFPNQINNVLAFPGVFRGALDIRARDINDAMKIAAARALSELVSETELRADYIIPSIFDPRVKSAVSSAVSRHPPAGLKAATRPPAGLKAATR